jgi:hypothetical protein
MNVSLDQAIDIHAKALTYRYGRRAPVEASQRGRHCEANGDREGRGVWERVATTAERLLNTELPA